MCIHACPTNLDDRKFRLRIIDRGYNDFHLRSEELFSFFNFEIRKSRNGVTILWLLYNFG
jgi:hypothetical protein